MEMEMERVETSFPVIHQVSKSIVRPSSYIQVAAKAEHTQPQPWRRRIDLAYWDLRLLSIHYNQKGILFPKPQHQSAAVSIIPSLISSLSLALDHFFPLAGRLATTKHDTSPPSLSLFIDCNDQGAEFIHAIAADVTVSDILTPRIVPPIVRSFFPLNGALCHDGHFLPLLAVQATELADGVFLGCSMNHAVVDGSSFWHFVNSWSEISRTGHHEISRPPILDRWFLESRPPPIQLPFSDLGDLIKRPPPLDNVAESVFQFSAPAIRKLKAAANTEMKTDRISSLQALLAHVWRCVVRARKLGPDQETSYRMAAGCRSRLDPPLPAGYFGNCIIGVSTKASAGELLDQGLGWAAQRLNEAVGLQTDTAVRELIESWKAEDGLAYSKIKPTDFRTASSPRFDVYGNDFGWGRPVAVLSGDANKMDGKVSVYPGKDEEGGISVEICLSPRSLDTLFEDNEFMDGVNGSS